MARFTTWLANSVPNTEDYISEFLAEELARKAIIARLQKDLYDLALQLGQTSAQAITKIDSLFSTLAAEWAIYTLTGSPSITTAIQNDATIPWLDTDVAGQTIRQRLISRLS